MNKLKKQFYKKISKNRQGLVKRINMQTVNEKSPKGEWYTGVVLRVWVHEVWGSNPTPDFLLNFIFFFFLVFCLLLPYTKHKHNFANFSIFLWKQITQTKLFTNLKQIQDQTWCSKIFTFLLSNFCLSSFQISSRAQK